MRFFEKLAKNLFGILLIFILPLMISTNPNKVEYTTFLESRFRLYAQEAICTEPLFSQECSATLKSKLEEDPTYLEKYVFDNTTRRNLYLFSLYTTNFDINLKIEKYKSVKRASFLVVGIVQNFIILQKPYWEDFKRN